MMKYETDDQVMWGNSSRNLMYPDAYSLGKIMSRLSARLINQNIEFEKYNKA